MHRVLVLLFALLLVVGCAARGEFVQLDEIPAEKARLVTADTPAESIFVGTSRQYDGKRFGSGRSATTGFVHYRILIPEDRTLGEVTWPRNAKRADPATDFLTLDAERFPQPAAFRTALRKEMTARRRFSAVVYVHGYNNTMAESVYRVAQMHHDLDVPSVALHFAWPSRGSVFGYVYDRESAMFSRDGLEELLVEAVAAGADRIVIVAHSMGSMVAMETLRQIAIRGNRALLDRISGVLLISPDLDIDVFHSEAMAIGRLPRPFFIFGSRKDSVLGVSSRLSGQSNRLGNMRDLSPIADLEVTYLDTSAYNQGVGHFDFGTSPALLRLLSGIRNIDAAFQAEASARVGLLPGAVLTLRRATGVILAPVEAVADSAH